MFYYYCGWFTRPAVPRRLCINTPHAHPLPRRSSPGRTPPHHRHTCMPHVRCPGELQSTTSSGVAAAPAQNPATHWFLCPRGRRNATRAGQHAAHTRNAAPLTKAVHKPRPAVVQQRTHTVYLRESEPAEGWCKCLLCKKLNPRAAQQPHGHVRLAVRRGVHRPVQLRAWRAHTMAGQSV